MQEDPAGITSTDLAAPQQVVAALQSRLHWRPGARALEEARSCISADAHHSTNSIASNSASQVMGMARVDSLLSASSIQALIGRFVDSKAQATIKQTLDIAYKASLFQYEGRTIRFALAFDLDHQRMRPVQRFSTKIELTPKQLQAISAAFRPESHCLVIAATKADGSFPAIIGTAPRPRSTVPPPQLYQPSVVVDVEAPGIVSLTIGESKAVFRRGEIYERSLGFTGLPLVRETERLIHEVCNPKESRDPLLLHGEQPQSQVTLHDWALQDAETRSIINRSACRLYDQTLESIARKMLKARRGGAVLLLPESCKTGKLVHGGRWYKSPDSQIFDQLVLMLRLEAISRQLFTGTPKSIETNCRFSTAGKHYASEQVRPALRSTLASLDNACQHCSDLTEADGATILGTDFGIRGFSAKLSSFHNPLPEPLATFLETRGNRHRSMAGAIASQPGAIGLVVSQDGDVTVFTHEPGCGISHGEIVL